jgi:uncharacterized membrane protein YdbT with pleckstrin-like domain
MKPLRIIKDFRYFESQEEGEWVIMITRKHWLALVSPFIWGIFIALILVIFSRLVLDSGERYLAAISDNAASAFEVLIVMYATLVSFGTWLIRYFNGLVLTNRHIIDVSQRAFFARSVSTLALENIEDVNIDKNGFLATIFDYGDLRIQTAGELPNFELKMVADPERVQRLIMNAKDGNYDSPPA